MSVNERIKMVIAWLISSGIAKNRNDIGHKMGYNNKSYLSQVINGRVNVSNEFINSLCGLDENINRDWVLKGEGEMLNKNQSISIPNEMENNSRERFGEEFYKKEIEMWKRMYEFQVEYAEEWKKEAIRVKQILENKNK